MEHKSYMNISAFQTKYADGFKVGDIIVVQEKVDGANASFQYDTESDSLISFSRKNILTEKETLRGFKTMIDLTEKTKFKKYSDYRFYGEYLCSHTVPYPKEAYSKFYLFDIYDTINQKWIDPTIVIALAKELNLLTVPTFYIGEFISWEHLSQFIGVTALGGEFGEGIIVKNITRMNDPNTRLPFYTKLVTANFKEKMGAKVKEPLNPTELAKIKYEQELTAIIVTKPRIQKVLHKLVDQGILEEDWGIEQMGIVAKHLSRIIYNDCIKEESEIVNQVGNNFGKICGSLSMVLAKEIVSEK